MPFTNDSPSEAFPFVCDFEADLWTVPHGTWIIPHTTASNPLFLAAGDTRDSARGRVGSAPLRMDLVVQPLRGASPMRPRPVTQSSFART